MIDPAELPIQEIRAGLGEALRGQNRFVLEAPTGSGKSTQVPQMLVDEGIVPDGQVVVLQPRRIAARMLAKRVASERGVPLGGEVGYQVRFDSKVGPDTRIRYITEGLLLRQLLDDPALAGIGAIIFDEFHERHLYGDVGLAQALWVQQKHRPELLVGVMSATLDSAGLMDYLGPCVHLVSEGRTFPVDVEFAGASSRAGSTDPWDQAAYHCNRLLGEGAEGDVLIFMPGAYEINRTIQALQGLPHMRDCVCLPLFGDLPPEQQDAALDDYDRRKIIVSTNVAETSLTIDGVRIVLDAGLARMPGYDPRRGINTLLVEKISRASADQRAGRAGRTAPGRCLRLWTEKDHLQRKPREVPEIRRVDLSEIILTLKAGGIAEINTLPWFDAPDALAVERAEMLLRDLGALDDTGALTQTGRRMASFPLHPRYARLFLAANGFGCLPAACLIAAFAQGRGFVLPLENKRSREDREALFLDADAENSDSIYHLRAWEWARGRNFNTGDCRKLGIHAQAARQAGQAAQQFIGIARQQGLDVGKTEWHADDLRKCLLLAFADHLAKRRDRGTLSCALVHGRRGEVRRQSMVRNAPLFVSTEIEERDLRGDVTVLLGMNTVVEERWLEELFPGEVSRHEETVYDTGIKRVVGSRRIVFRDLVLDETVAGEPDLDKAARILAEEVVAGRVEIKAWDASVEGWIERVNFIAEHAPDYEFEPIGDDERLMLLEQLCYGSVSAKEVRGLDPWPILHDWLTAEQLACVDNLAPVRYVLPNGRRARIRYEQGRATLSAVLQQMYDVKEQPTLCGGKVDVVVELLAPNNRPVQVTNDIGGFWTGAYEDVKKQLKGRYPKHEWR